MKETLYQTFSVDLTNLFLISLAAFVLAMLLTPVYTLFAYRYRFWKKQRKTSTTGEALKVFTKLHENKFERNIPTMAGIIGVVVVVLLTLVFNLERGQTWLPLAALVGGAIVGLLDDIINLKGNGHGVAGLRASIKFSMIIALGVALGWFFFAKLGFDIVQIPFFGHD